MDVCRRFPGSEFWTNIFTPYPGAPIMEKVAELGIQTPDSLRGLGLTSFPRYTKLPWLNGRDHERTAGNARLSPHRFRSDPHFGGHAQTHYPAGAKMHLAARPAGAWTMVLTDFPVELWLNKKLKERTAALKPAVDAKRLEPNTVEATC